MSHVARAGYAHGLAFDVYAARLEHFEQEIYVSVTGSFGTDKRTAEFQTFSGKRAGIFVCEFLIHSEHVAYFASAYAYVACRNVGIRTDIAPQLGHESLAETHNLAIALAAGAEIRTTLCATHRKRGKRVLESLLERKELQDTEVY